MRCVESFQLLGLKSIEQKDIVEDAYTLKLQLNLGVAKCIAVLEPRNHDRGRLVQLFSRAWNLRLDLFGKQNVDKRLCHYHIHLGTKYFNSLPKFEHTSHFNC